MRRRGVPEGQFGPWSNPANEPCDDPSFGEERCEVARERGVVEGSLADGRVEPFERAGVRPTRVGAQACRGQRAGGVGGLGERTAAVAKLSDTARTSVSLAGIGYEPDSYRNARLRIQPP